MRLAYEKRKWAKKTINLNCSQQQHKLICFHAESLKLISLWSKQQQFETSIPSTLSNNKHEKIERKNTHTTTTQKQNQEQEPGQLPGGVYETPDYVQAG